MLFRSKRYVGDTSFAFVIIEGVIRLTLVVGYIWLVSRWEEIQRVFQYHGAEHKTIHAYENGDPLVVDRIQGYSPRHPRCGTSFLLIVGWGLRLVASITVSIGRWAGLTGTRSSGLGLIGLRRTRSIERFQIVNAIEGAHCMTHPQGGDHGPVDISRFVVIGYENAPSTERRLGYVILPLKRGNHNKE